MLHYNEMKNNAAASGTPRAVISQVQEAVVGKADIIEQIMMAILAKGHVLVEDIPGTGKTTMALAFSHAMGLKDADVLSAGKAADIIMIDLNQPNMQPINNIAKNLVYSGSKQNVIMTMINGKILYEKGCFYTADQPEKIYQKAEQIRKKIMG